MSLALLTLGLLCIQPAHADTYPGGGYPGGGYPGGGSSQGSGHYWKITYSNSGTISYAIPDVPILGESIPKSEPWSPTDSITGFLSGSDINGNATGSVTATLTWIPAVGQTLQSDPPSKKVSIEEVSFAAGAPGKWGDDEAPTPSPVGSADDGLGDPQVPFFDGYSSSGTHRVRKDGSSGTITLGPFTLKAINPAST